MLRQTQFCSVVFLSVFFALFAAALVHASPDPVPEKAGVIIIGDRLVDIAYHLGVVPAAMSVRCSLWPMCDSLKKASQVLGCPSCLAKKKGKPLFDFARKQGLKKVILEKGSPFCTYMPHVKPEGMAGLLREKGMDVSIVEYTGSLEPTVREMARLLGREDRTATLLETYRSENKKTMDTLAGKTFAPKVVIINGVFQESTGKTFLRIEAPGGYVDRYLLAPLGSKNTGAGMVPKDKTPSKGHFSVRKLTGLIKAAPEAIVITGDGLAVQKAIEMALKKNPALARVPAIERHAIYSLPGFVSSSLVGYPLILRRWAKALEKGE